MNDPLTTHELCVPRYRLRREDEDPSVPPDENIPQPIKEPPIPPKTEPDAPVREPGPTPPKRL